MFFELSKVPSSVDDITVSTSGSTSNGSTATETTAKTSTTQPASGGVTTPPADPAQSGTSTQGGDSK
jgi:hypothetical protein